MGVKKKRLILIYHIYLICKVFFEIFLKRVLDKKYIYAIIKYRVLCFSSLYYVTS